MARLYVEERGPYSFWMNALRPAFSRRGARSEAAAESTGRPTS